MFVALFAGPISSGSDTASRRKPAAGSHHAPAPPPRHSPRASSPLPISVPEPHQTSDDATGVTGCAAVDRRALGLRRDMRHDIHRSQFVDEVLGIVALVGAERDPTRPVQAINSKGSHRAVLGAICAGCGPRR